MNTLSAQQRANQKYSKSPKGKATRLARRATEYAYFRSPRGREVRRGIVARTRRQALMLLGGRCFCGWNDDRALQIDHIDGIGPEGRESERMGLRQFYRFVLAHPDRFQILCANHNWVKRCEKGEHTTRTLDNQHP